MEPLFSPNAQLVAWLDSDLDKYGLGGHEHGDG